MLTHEKGESEEDLNLENEDIEVDEAELDKELSDLGEDDQSLFDYIHEQTGKTFKDKASLVKTLRQMDVEFSKGKTPKKEEQPSQPDTSKDVSEIKLRLDKPDSVYVIEMIKKNHPTEDPYKVYTESEYYQKEAATRAEKEQAKARMQTPSNQSGEGKDKSDEEIIAQKFMKNLPSGFEFKK